MIGGSKTRPCAIRPPLSPLLPGPAFRERPAWRRALILRPVPRRRSGFPMKVTVERAELLKSLGHVHRVVERRNTIPILANVLIKADKRQAQPEGHRPRSRGHRERSPPRCRRAAPPPCRRTCSTRSCASCPRARRSCSRAPATAPCSSLRAGRSRFTLQTLPESDFPDLAAGEMTHTFKLAAADLKRLIDKTQFAISTEETRYYLNGIYLHTAGTAKAATLRAVATDGHRLAQVELPLPDGRRRHAGHHRAAQDRGRGAAPDRRPAKARWRSNCPPARSASRSATWC